MRTIPAPPTEQPRLPATATPRPPRTRPTPAFPANRSFETHAGFVLPFLERGLEVLDVGCGFGAITQGLAERVLPGRVTAVDRDPQAIARATRLAEGLELTNVRFTTADAEALPFADASFDLVFAHALFEHLERPLDALAEIRRVLRPCGTIALASADWDGFELRNATPGATEALAAYRALEERRGVNPRAGAQLTRWIKEAGFAFLRQGNRTEAHGSTVRAATHLALELDAAGQTAAARELIDWSVEPAAELRSCWRHVLGVKWNP